MTTRPLVALFVVAACGGAPPSPAPSVSVAASVAASVDAAVDTAVDAPPPPPPPPPIATLEGVIVAGVHEPEDIAAMLSGKLPELATCLSGDGVARATEVSFVAVGNATQLRVAWQDGVPIERPCLGDVLGPKETLTIDWRTKFSVVYAVLRSAPPGTEPPPAPTPPDRRADVQLLFCDLFIVSGAEHKPTPEAQNIAVAYGRAHARHPAAIRITIEISQQWSPQDLDGKLKRALRAEGIKRCALQRF